MKKKKGFTLIELMIVLAIIAILAVVLIPKAGIFKNQSRNAGVTTNVNAVRAYLETKIKDSGGASSYFNSTELETAVRTSFDLDSSGVSSNPTSNESLVNPIDKTKVSIDVNDSTDPTLVPGEVVIVVMHSATPATDSNISGYKVYGVDNGGSRIQEYTIK